MLSLPTIAIALASLLLPIAMPPTAHAAPVAGPIVERAIDGFVRPAYAGFHASTTRLVERMDALCDAPSAGAFEAVKAGFAETVDAWSRAEIIRFGPVVEGNRLERILFWPDRKGTGLKQVQAALAERDESATDPVRLAGKSVAMQGLGALEFILFGTGAESLSAPTDPYRCAYGKAVAVNLDTMARALDAAWAAPDGIANAWAKPGAGNAFYHDDGEALGELLDVFVNGLELVRDVRLNGFLGKKPGEDKPRLALFWRSGATASSLAANLEALKALFDASGLGAQLAPDTRWIAQSIDFEFDNGIGAAKAASGHAVEETLGTPELRGKLDYLRVVTSSLSELFGKRLAAEFGITSGFSSLDGD
jgi:predicted lipoprotein